MKYKVGDKFIIEIESVYTPHHLMIKSDDPSYLYRIKGFNSLVFDDSGLDKLENLNIDKRGKHIKMNIINSTDAILTIDGNKIHPGESYNTDEHIFDTTNVFSDIGAVEIITEYSKRYFKCYGKLKAEELESKDDQGLSEIKIYNK